MEGTSKIEESFDVPMLPRRPPDDDPDAEFFVRCFWNDDHSLQELHLRRREKNESLPQQSEILKNETLQLLKGREIIQMRNPSGIVWKIRTEILDSDETNYETNDGHYQIYITWDINKRLQEAQITRRANRKSVPPPVKKKTYLIMEVSKPNFIIARDGRGLLKKMVLTLGPRFGRFGPAEPPPHVVRYRNLVFRWGPNGEVTNRISTNVARSSSV